jgi:hypothetical protein
MRVLIACEFSGIVREAFKAKGHYAMSCDLEPTEIPGEHYQGDIFDVINNNWDLMIAHPPCTRLANSGVMWLQKRNLWFDMERAALFFKKLLNAKILKIAVENPIPHRYALEVISEKYSQIIQPYQFGHLERKATCLWLKGLPELRETNNIKIEMSRLPKNQSQRIHYLPPSKDRAKLRSITFTGIAEAMANQWGNLVPTGI